MKGVYLIGYIEAKEEKPLKSVSKIRYTILKVCKFMKLNMVKENFHAFKNPYGITYCLILSQSHFIIHTWPEEFKIFFDVFTCNKQLNEEKLVRVLSKEFKGKVKEIRRIEHK